MKAVILKGFNVSNQEFKKDEIIDMPVSAFHKLSLKGLVKPYLPDVSEEEHAYLKAEFERIFAEHVECLRRMPITISVIKKLYPKVYEKLRELERKLDEAWLTFDYEAFTEALREIEETLQAYQIYEEEAEEDKPKEPKPIQKKLNRACINCGGNQWLIMKPNSKTSTIKCLNCNHMELNIRVNSEKN